MATIQSQLRLNDGMSAVLRNVTAALDTCLRSFEEMRAASGSAMDVSAIAEARVELLSANNTIEQMERNSRDAENAQRGYNRAVQAGNSSLDGMLSKVKGVVATLAAASGVRNLIGTSDQMAGATARLSLIVDDQNSVESLQQKIFASAQASRGAYLDVMDTVGKLGLTAGDAFTGNDEMIRFAQLMNQNFIIAGASATEQSSAMYQLTQAMAAGKLQALPPTPTCGRRSIPRSSLPLRTFTQSPIRPLPSTAPFPALERVIKARRCCRLSQAAKHLQAAR